jgi:transcriptional regulator with XRE-family HTH domain
MVRPNVLRLIRVGKGKSRRVCAEAIGVDESTWKRWELGMLTPSSRNLLDAAAYLGVRAEELREITDPKKDRPAARPGGRGVRGAEPSGGSIHGTLPNGE